jgi:hypothetical protein
MPPGTFRAVWTSKPTSCIAARRKKCSGASTVGGWLKKRNLTTDNHDVIATLNDLLEICRDGEQGFHTCVEGVESPNLKALFEVAARRCAEGPVLPPAYVL